MRFFLTLMLCSVFVAYGMAQETKATSQPVKVPVSLTPGEAGSKLAPRYSPPGRQLKLQPLASTQLAGFDHLSTHLPLGPDKKAAGLQLVVARSEKGKPYTLLYVQDRATGTLSEKPITIKPSVNRNKTWSSFEALVHVNHPSGEKAEVLQPYPIALWIVVDQESDTPVILRISRRGFLHGEVSLGNAKYQVVLSDSNNDGVLGTGDWWELRGQGAAGSMRTVGDFAWAGGKAWKLELNGTDGRSGQLVSHDPGMTEEEDTQKRDRLRADRLAPRAAKPVDFRKDVDEVLKEAVEKKVACFIKFETDWCVPCKQMTELVFTAKDVADAAQGISCVIVDGDARKDLTEKYKVKAYPTGVLLDAEGNEIARYVGYQSVKETSLFLKKVKK